jgi:hypothetical protein
MADGRAVTDDTVGRIVSARVANPGAIAQAAAARACRPGLTGASGRLFTLKLPTVRGMVIGRALLYPPGGDVASVVDRTVGLL